MTLNGTESDNSERTAYIIRSGEEYDDWTVDAVFTERGKAIEWIKNRCGDFSEFTEWDDGGGIIWNSEEPYVAGYRVDVADLNPDPSRTEDTGADIDE